MEQMVAKLITLWPSFASDCDVLLPSSKALIHDTVSLGLNTVFGVLPSENSLSLHVNNLLKNLGPGQLASIWIPPSREASLR